MSVEAKEILQFLGIDESVESIDALKEEFGTTFIRRDMVKADDELAGQIWGKKSGILQKQMIKLAQKIGFEIPDTTYKTTSHEETLAMMFDHLSEKHEAELEAANAKAGSGGTNSKEFLDLEKAHKKAMKELAEKTTLLNDIQTEYDNYKGEHTKEKKNGLLKNYWNESKSKVKLSKDINPLVLKGLEAEYNELYEHVVDDEGKEVYVVLRENGQRVKSAKKASSFATADELFEQLALKNKALDLTPEQRPGAKKPVVNHFAPDIDGQDDADDNIHPAAREAVKKEQEALNK